MSEAPKPTTTTMLAHIDQRLAVIESRLEIIGDHESRIRELEKARWQSAWITSISTAVAVAVIVSLISRSVA